MDPSQMIPRSFPMWPPLPPPSSGPDSMPPFLPPPNANLVPNRGWKRKNPNPSSGGASYQPPAIGDLQVQNRAKARRWFNNPNASNPNSNNRKPFFPNKSKANKPRAAAAPRNTTSFIIRAKRAGGIAPLVSPCPVTPAVLPTPVISPSRDEGLLSDVLAQRQWGVDGYGSMKGIIRLRPHPPNDEDDDNSSGGSSDVEEHVEVERRIDHDLSRFEMVCPQLGGEYVIEEDDEYDRQRQDVDVHVARLEEENLTLKERLFLMEQEVGDMRRRQEVLEARFSGTIASSGNAASVEARENMSNANAADSDAVLKNDTEMANATGADNTVEAALENGTERVDAASSAGNAVEKALKDDTEMDDAAADADNAVEEALENGTEKAGKSVEEDSADRAGAGSQENAEIGDAGSAQETGEEIKQA
uniref:Uncharacterized protein n=1 Tax=Avena sativa TaxID=4498 RepID=A0ACD5Y5Y5_AVESA